jgi:hypothetical protein
MNDEERIRALTDRDKRLNTFGMWMFRDVADADYVGARLACRTQLPVQFLWASQQALEKYLKCILFIRRIPATNVRHKLGVALDLVESSGIPLKLTDRSRKFVAEIDAVGAYRYMEASIAVNWTWIVLLDQCVWELRRFCTLDPKVTSAMLVEGKWAPRTRIVHGYLERILDKRQHPARTALVWNNGFFGRGRRTVKPGAGIAVVNSPMVRNLDLLDDVLRYAYIPNDVVKAYRAQATTKQKPPTSGGII